MFLFGRAAALVLAGWLAAPQTAHAQSERAAGEAAFAARCARCHQIEALQGYLNRRPDDAARRADLEAFLARHHARDAVERAAIIHWLLAGRPAKP